MSKRLQVILGDRDYADLQKAARSRGVSIAVWVRDAIAKARQDEPSKDIETKLAIVRAAAKLNYPTADIDQMLAEIEQGYESGPKP